MQLDLKKMPFSKALSRHMIYEETANQSAGWVKGLYLAHAYESGHFFGGPAAGPKGFIRLTPTYGGQAQNYDYIASPFMLELQTTQGGMRFAMDGTKVIRIEGKGIGLRFDAKLGFGHNAITTARGVEIWMGATVYLLKALQGTITLDCKWDLKALKLTDPIITIEPGENGIFEMAIFDTDDKYQLPQITMNLDQCAAATKADYQDFTAGLKKSAFFVSDEHFNFFVYCLWIGIMPFAGQALACKNKLIDQKTYLMEQSVVAMSFAAPQAIDIISTMLDSATPSGLIPTWVAEPNRLYEAVPPLYAYTVSRLTETNAIRDAAPEKLSALYDKMAKAVNWWQNNRTNDNGLCYYAYRHECGWQNEDIFGCHTPAATPDLAAYMTLAYEALSAIAAILGKSTEALSWNELSRKQLDNLTKRLWDGQAFRSVNAMTGDLHAIAGILTCMPLILGKRLPAEISAFLVGQLHTINWESAAIIPATLIIMGLIDGGSTDEAALAFQKLISSCSVGGAYDLWGHGTAAGAFYDSAACAALLAISGRIQ